MILHRMKKIFLHIFFFAMFMLPIFSSCKKETEVTFGGRVYDVITHAAVPNAKVTVLATGFVMGAASANYHVVGTAMTDETGNFSIVVPNEMFIKLRIHVAKAGFYAHTCDFNPSDETVVYDKDMPITGISTLKVKVKNVIPRAATDELCLRLLDLHPLSDVVTTGLELHFYGVNVDTTCLFDVAADDTVTISYFLVDNHAPKDNRRTVVCPRQDTAYEVVTY